MSRMQVMVVSITIGLNALDGFDVLSISFAAPGIADEWGLAPSLLGIVLSMELIGMACGSLLLGGLADWIGRKPTMLGCVTIMALGMFMAATAADLVTLSTWRVITGLGVGGLVATINAVAAEFSSAKRRHFCVSLMAIGYPVGAVVGGTIASRLLEAYGWVSVFYVGGAMTAAFIPLILFCVPESIHWLAEKQPPGALLKINRALERMGHGAITSLPNVSGYARRRSSSDLFTKSLLATTAIVTAAYFFHITTFYFVLKWVPKMVVDMGFAAAAAGGILVWTNIGGAIGGAALGVMTLRFRLKPVVIGVLALSVITTVMFGRTPPDLGQLALMGMLTGFCANAGVVGLYAIFAQAFPTHVRAFGTGFAIGVGRGGSVLAPIVAGFMFESGISIANVTLVMAAGSLVAAIVLPLLNLEPNLIRHPPQHARPTQGVT
jgi:benzoate transport